MSLALQQSSSLNNNQAAGERELLIASADQVRKRIKAGLFGGSFTNLEVRNWNITIEAFTANSDTTFSGLARMFHSGEVRLRKGAPVGGEGIVKIPSSVMDIFEASFDAPGGAEFLACWEKMHATSCAKIRENDFLEDQGAILEILANSTFSEGTKRFIKHLLII